MQVLVHDPAVDVAGSDVKALGFYELLTRSDFVICLAAATPETRHLFNASAFAAMRPGSFFLNLSRGALVDDAGLEASLDEGHLGGAGLDVGTAPDERPATKFFARSDVLATPHIGGVTAEARRHQATYAVEQVKAIAAGSVPEGAINLEAACRFQNLLRNRGVKS